MGKLLDANKPKLLTRFVQLEGFTFSKPPITSVSRPTIGRYKVSANVTDATFIQLSRLQNETAPDGKSTNLVWYTKWRPIIRMTISIELCQSNSKCQTFLGTPQININDEFRRVLRWPDTTNKPLQLSSSEKGTVNLGESKFISFGPKSDRIFRFQGWRKLFESQIKDIVLGRVLAVIRKSLRPAVDDWLDQDVFPAFAREMTSSNKVA